MGYRLEIITSILIFVVWACVDYIFLGYKGYTRPK